nr:MAG TPA: hypothetical protein [Crassvirales sp.]
MGGRTCTYYTHAYTHVYNKVRAQVLPNFYIYIYIYIYKPSLLFRIRLRETSSKGDFSLLTSQAWIICLIIL